MPMSFEDFMAAFPMPESKPLKPAPKIDSTLFIDTGDANAKRLHAARTGVEWHNNVRDIVASMVSAGVSDEIIVALAPAITLDDYTVDQTIAELRPMIRGARQKGFGEVQIDEDDPLAGYTIMSAQELSAKVFPPIDWLIPQLLPKPALTMLAGPPKVGKSWLCFFFALQVAEAGHEVVYLASEDNDPRLQSRLSALCPFPPPDIHFIAGLSCERPLPKGQAAHAFIRALKAKYPAMKCLVVDTLASIRAAPASKTKKDEYTLSEEEFSGLRKLAHDLNLSIIVVHHTRKAKEGDASPVETILGSQGIAATVETIMVMKPEIGSQDVGLYITGKDVEQQELVLPWQSPGFGWPQDMVEGRLGTFQQKCLEYVRAHPRCTQAAIVEHLNCDKGQLSAAVNKMITSGLISRREGLLAPK